MEPVAESNVLRSGSPGSLHTAATTRPSSQGELHDEEAANT